MDASPGRVSVFAGWRTDWMDGGGWQGMRWKWWADGRRGRGGGRGEPAEAQQQPSPSVSLRRRGGQGEEGRSFQSTRTEHTDGRESRRDAARGEEKGGWEGGSGSDAGDEL